MKNKTFIYLVVSTVAFVIGYGLNCIVKTNLIKSSLEFAQIIGVFAGLSLAAIGIMMTLPLRQWLDEIKEENLEERKSLIELVREIPGWFHRHLVVQFICFLVAIVIGVTPDEAWPLHGGWSKAASGLVFSAITVSGYALYALFVMMKDLLTASFARF